MDSLVHTHACYTSFYYNSVCTRYYLCALVYDLYFHFRLTASRMLTLCVTIRKSHLATSGETGRFGVMTAKFVIKFEVVFVEVTLMVLVRPGESESWPDSFQTQCELTDTHTHTHTHTR